MRYTLESGLERSVAAYEELLGFMESLAGEMEQTSPAALVMAGSKMTELHTTVKTIDESFVHLLVDIDTMEEPLRVLLERRITLLAQLLAINKKLSAAAAGAKSLLAHEMKTMRRGISAHGGYRQKQHNHGRIVNSTR